MTLCAQGHRKYKKEGNFCGKSRSQFSRELAYLEIVEKIESTGLDEKFIYEHFPAGAARPMVSLSDDATRTTALNFVVTEMKAGRKITQGELHKKIDGWLAGNPISCNVNARSKMLSNGTGEIPPLRVEKPKKKEPYNGTPQKDDYPAPPAPMAQTLKEKYGGQEPVPEHGRFKDADNPEMISPPPNVEKPPCQEGKPCPADRNYLIKQPILGNKCEQTGRLIKDMTTCPILVRQTKAEELGFGPASDYDPLTGGTFIKHPPYKITKVPEVISFTPSQKQYDFIQRVIKSGEFETAVEFLSELIDRAMEQEES